jgi:hypothetical protein
VTDVPVVTLVKGRTADNPATFHIGFIQPTEAAVDALHARFSRALRRRIRPGRERPVG